jgi:molybdopterin-guanine dinucleotide biosynthesis protein A
MSPTAAGQRAITRAQITGVVLAGGLARRMGEQAAGTDKGLLHFGTQPMVARVIDRLSPQVASMIINANRHLDAWQTFGLPVVSDRIEGFAGPLAGLHAAMAASTTPWVATVPCDSPFLPLDLVARLSAAAFAEHAQVAVACTGDQPHPVFALARCDLVDHLAQFLASGRRRIDAWYSSLRAVHVPFDDEHAFVNINTPEDLQHHAPASRP